MLRKAQNPETISELFRPANYSDARKGSRGCV